MEVMQKVLNVLAEITIPSQFMIFIFGGEAIRGFMFALIVGVLVGTYSSLFIATPVMFDTTRKKK